MDEAALLEGLKQAVLDYDADRGVALVRQGLERGLPPLRLIDEGLSPGIAVIGEKFQAMEIFLPELMMAAKVFLEAMKVLEPAILAQGAGYQKRGVAVIGTVKGDVHSIGKDLFGTLLKVAGFEVHNLGVNVHPGKFVEKAEETGAQIVGLSALMTTTMPSMREVIEFFEARGIRERHTILVGGGPVTEAFARRIAADGYGETAQAGVTLAIRFVEQMRAAGQG
ncbi:MAG: corrinoid protein [Armatimonadota bacterium]|nr:corrinoid protein [Armatimonadota bacterium]MDR7535005.1 corrinoid protein [Armatimonadota bacterium]